MLFLVSLVIVGDVDAGWVHMACHGRTLTMVALDLGWLSCCARVGRAEVKNWLTTRRLHIVIGAYHRTECACQVALIVELRGVRERCVYVYPDLALGLDPSRAHLERVNSRTVCQCSVYPWVLRVMVRPRDGP